jgi:hypothetical protein
MKLKDLIHEPSLEVRVEEALKKMDWNFDIDATDDVRLEKGTAALKQAHTLVGALYSQRPELASALWEAYCPYAQPGSLSSTLLRK